jgi:ethanolamine utilization protein EutQ (cupin superfamily)
MMSTQTVSVPTYDARNDNRFGPAKIEHRTAGSGLYQLGSYFMVYDAEDHSEPWTVQYEETIYVIEGQSRLLIITGDTEQEVIGNPGDLIAIPQGTTLRYGAALGTRLLLSISPVNWRETS